MFTTFVGYIAGGIPGAAVATIFVFLPSFVFVLGGVHYIEKVRENRGLQAFLAGVSAAVVGVIAVVSLDLIPQALVDWATVGISLAAFVLIAFLKRDVALVAIGAIIGGVIYAGSRMAPWCATALSLGLLFAPRVTRFFAGILVSVTTSDFLHRAYARMKEEK